MGSPGGGTSDSGGGGGGGTSNSATNDGQPDAASVAAAASSSGWGMMSSAIASSNGRLWGTTSSSTNNGGNGGSSATSNSANVGGSNGGGGGGQASSSSNWSALADSGSGGGGNKSDSNNPASSSASSSSHQSNNNNGATSSSAPTTIAFSAAVAGSGSSALNTSASASANHSSTSNHSGPSPVVVSSTSPKPVIGSWAQAACKGLNQSMLGGGGGGNNNNSSSSSLSNNNSNNAVINNTNSAASGGGGGPSSSAAAASSAAAVSSSYYVSIGGVGGGSSNNGASQDPVYSNNGGGGHHQTTLASALSNNSNNNLCSSNSSSNNNTVYYGNNANQSSSAPYSSSTANNLSSMSNNNSMGGNGGGGQQQQHHQPTSSHHQLSAAEAAISATIRARNSVQASITDIIGNLSDGFRQTLLMDKWDPTVINQDSPWDLPPSPTNASQSPSHDDASAGGGGGSGGSSNWKPNSGTEIWASAARQKKLVRVMVNGGNGGQMEKPSNLPLASSSSNSQSANCQWNGGNAPNASHVVATGGGNNWGVPSGPDDLNGGLDGVDSGLSAAMAASAAADQWSNVPPMLTNGCVGIGGGGSVNSISNAQQQWSMNAVTQQQGGGMPSANNNYPQAMSATNAANNWGVIPNGSDPMGGLVEGGAAGGGGMLAGGGQPSTKFNWGTSAPFDQVDSLASDLGGGGGNWNNSKDSVGLHQQQALLLQQATAQAASGLLTQLAGQSGGGSSSSAWNDVSPAGQSNNGAFNNNNNKSESGWDKTEDALNGSGSGGPVLGDDGTAVWGALQTARVSNWKDNQSKCGNNQAKNSFTSWPTNNNNNGSNQQSSLPNKTSQPQMSQMGLGGGANRGGGGSWNNDLQNKARGSPSLWNVMDNNGGGVVVDKSPSSSSSMMNGGGGQSSAWMDPQMPLQPPSLSNSNKTNNNSSLLWPSSGGVGSGDMKMNNGLNVAGQPGGGGQLTPNGWNDNNGAVDSVDTSAWGSSSGNNANNCSPNGGVGGGRLQMAGNGQGKNSNSSNLLQAIHQQANFYSSKQFRTLNELGFNKEDVENVMRMKQMNFDEVYAYLSNDVRHPMPSSYDQWHTNGMDNRVKPNPLNISALAALATGNVINNLGNLKMSGSVVSGGGGGGASNMMGANSSRGNGGGGGAGGQGAQGQAPSQNSNNNSSSMISQTNMLYKRIQAAVTDGLISPNILNQPLSNANLEIVYELLQQTSNLQNYMRNNNITTNPFNGNAQQCKVISQFRQIIRQLQSQLTVQPNKAATGALAAVSSVKQQQPMANQDFFSTPYAAVTGNDGVSLDQFALSGSRLNNWKQNKQSSQQQQQPNSMPMMDQSDQFTMLNTRSKTGGGGGANWSNSFVDDPLGGGGQAMAPGWSDSTVQEYPGLNDFGSTTDYDYAGLPKPSWSKQAGGSRSTGGLTKDDGSFAWSNGSSKYGASHTAAPVAATSVGADAFGFGGGNLPPANNTWSYNTVQQPPPSMYNGGGIKSHSASGAGNVGGLKASGNWSSNSAGQNVGGLGADIYSSVGNESFWNGSVLANPSGGGGGGASKSRPPPGLTQVNHQSGTKPSMWMNGSNGEYLRLRNLSSQVDATTLKTLCLQHGPLSLFHVIHSMGLALARYSTREQALKAQQSLNGCFMGSTSILADIPNDGDVQQLLAMINQQQQQQQQQSASSSLHISTNWSNGGANHSSHSAQQQAQSGNYRGSSSSSSSMYRNNSFGSFGQLGGGGGNGNSASSSINNHSNNQTGGAYGNGNLFGSARNAAGQAQADAWSSGGNGGANLWNDAPSSGGGLWGSILGDAADQGGGQGPALEHYLGDHQLLTSVDDLEDVVNYD